MSSEILGVRFDGVTMDEAVAWALERIRRREGAYICTPNPETVWACGKSRALNEAVAGADMTLPDGIGVVWASRVLGRPVPERVSGYDFLMALLPRLTGRVFLLGGKPGVARRAGEVIGRQFPHITVAGCRDGYSEEGEGDLCAVQAAEPDVVLVCLGTPRQELWMAENRSHLSSALMIGLGGSLDVLAGDVKRAPEGWIRLNLEWLYRLLRQPGRIVRQVRLPLFVMAVLAEKIKKRGS